MRYSEEIIEEVRSRNDIVDVIGSYVQLKKKGANYFGLCPFHNEKSPSFSVSRSKQIYYCFGCGKGGNVISFIMDYENEPFVPALRILAERAGIELGQEEETEEEKRRSDERSALFEVQREAAKYFFYQTRGEQGKQGYEYLKGRGLDDETIRSFGLGYANSFRDDLYRYLKSKGFSDSILALSGVVRIDEKGARDLFFGRVMFPIMDISNRVIGFGGRIMGSGEPKYLNSPETPIFDKGRTLYGLNRAKKSREHYLLICEGYMDVIALHQAGFTNAVAALGTAFTPSHAMTIKRYAREVVLTFDSDQAGIKAALRAIPILREAGIAARVLTMKPHKDPDEFIRNMGKDAYRERIEGAVNAFMFEVAQLKTEYDFSDPGQKTAFFDEAARKLTVFADPLERNNYTEAVAREYQMDYSVLKDKVEHIPRSERADRAEAGASSEAVPAVRKKAGDHGLNAAERLVLNWLCEIPESRPLIMQVLKPEDYEGELYREAASLLYAQAEEGKIRPAEIIDHFQYDEEMRMEAARIFHTVLLEEAGREELQKEIRGSVARIKRRALDRRLEETGDVAVYEEVMKEKRRLDQWEKGKVAEY